MERKIDHYTFGRMTIDGREYASDIIIHADGRIQDSWWRKNGHDLLPEDIQSVLDDAPRRLIIGTGANGNMSVSSGVRDQCRKRGIKVEALPTASAVERYNEAAKNGETFAACFHLTC
ncbi:MAG: Mth938-like domain-containing protein [Thermodesulfobacteriota bacterium]